MAMTAAVKDELSRLVVTKPCCRRAEVAALLRFAGGLHIVGGRVVVEAAVDTGSVPPRPRLGPPPAAPRRAGAVRPHLRSARHHRRRPAPRRPVRAAGRPRR